MLVALGVALSMWGWYDPLRPPSPRLRDPKLSPDSVAILLNRHEHRTPLVLLGAACVLAGLAFYVWPHERSASRGRAQHEG